MLVRGRSHIIYRKNRIFGPPTNLVSNVVEKKWTSRRSRIPRVVVEKKLQRVDAGGSAGFWLGGSMPPCKFSKI